MTDNDCLRNAKASLQSLIASIDAQLEGVPQHPVDPPPPPPPPGPRSVNVFTTYADRGLSIAQVETILNRRLSPQETADAIAAGVTPLQSGEGHPTPFDASGNAGARSEEHNSPSFDPDNESSYRFMNGEAGKTATKTYPAKESGVFVAGIYDAGGITAGVDVEITGPGVHVFWPGCHIPFSGDVPDIQAGQSYEVALSSPARFATTVTIRKKR